MIMRKDMVDLLCCPVCKGELQLRVDAEENGEILEGSFLCKNCDVEYTIEEGIPNLLPPDHS